MKNMETSKSGAWRAVVLVAAGLVTATCLYLLIVGFGQVAVLIGSLLFAVGACVGLIWKRPSTGRLTVQEERGLRRCATILKDSNDAITIQDVQGRIIAWNHGAKLMYGYSEAEALDMNIDRLTAPGKVAEQKEFIRRLAAGETVHSFETQRVTQDGRILDVWMTVTVLRDDAGHPIELASTERDLTARNRAHERIRRMATVMRDSNDAINVQDFEGNITDWNCGAKQVYGYSEEEALAKNIKSLTTPDKVQEQADFIRRLVDGEAVSSFETQRVTKDGRVLDVWLTLTKLLDDSGNPIGLASFERDITDRKQAAEKMAQQLDELRRWQEVTLGRETRVIDLKREVNELLTRLGENAKYESENRES